MHLNISSSRGVNTFFSDHYRCLQYGNISIFFTAEMLRGPWHPEEVQQTRLYNEFTVDVGQAAYRI